MRLVAGDTRRLSLEEGHGGYRKRVRAVCREGICGSDDETSKARSTLINREGTGEVPVQACRAMLVKVEERFRHAH